MIGGAISHPEAKDLRGVAQDGPGPAAPFHTGPRISAQDGPEVEESERRYDRQIDGEQYDRELLEKAEGFAMTGGAISHPEAKDLWEVAQDGPGPAASFHTRPRISAQDGPEVEESERRYDRQIDGEKYDRELLEKAEGFAMTG